MKRDMYKKIENYMLSCMNDGAHDNQHIYRVLFHALDIAANYKVNKDVLIAASLLHDIGRDLQFSNPQIDHAIAGANMAYEFLKQTGWSDNSAQHVRDCISTHRYRNNNPPVSIEAKILFDSDKLDATGTLGIARTLAYKGIVSEPLYCLDGDGNVLDGRKDNEPSFFQEYNFKLRNVYDKFYTDRAKEIAEMRRKSSIRFYENMFDEVISTHKAGRQLLLNELD